jgi:hypothetical protein
MSKELFDPKALQVLMNKHFDGIDHSAVSHVTTSDGKHDLYVMLVQADGNKEHVSGAGNGTQPKHHPQTHAAKADRLDSEMTHHLSTLMQTPLMWDGCTDKEHCGGPTPVARPRKHKEKVVPHHDARGATKTTETTGKTNGAHTAERSEDPVSNILDLMPALDAAPAGSHA